jgi:hypothetical protein
MSIILEKLDKDIVDTKKTIRDIQQDSANLPQVRQLGASFCASLTALPASLTSTWITFTWSLPRARSTGVLFL